jgi:hypothetical protein
MQNVFVFVNEFKTRSYIEYLMMTTVFPGRKMRY